MLDLPLARARHRVPEPHEPALVLRQLEPREVAQLRVEREVERRDVARHCALTLGCGSSGMSGGRGVLGRGRAVVEVRVGAAVRLRRALLGQRPFRQAGDEFQAFVSALEPEYDIRSVSLETERERGGRTYVMATKAATPSVSLYFFSGLREGAVRRWF